MEKRTKSRILPPALLASALFLAGCGGGGGDGDGSPTQAPDTAPNAFGFEELKNAAPGLVYESAPVTITGMDEGEPAAVSVKDGEYAIGEGGFTSEPGEIRHGESVRVRLDGPDSFESQASATLDIGGVTAAFTVSTSAPEFRLEPGFRKLKFSWDSMAGVTHYRLLENPDGGSGFAPLLDSVDGDSDTAVLEIPDHFTDWVNAQYALEACNQAGCSMLPEFVLGLVQEQSNDAIGYFKASNAGADDQFGYSVAISSDGNVMAVGAPGEDSGSAGVNEEQNDDVDSAGAVYVFRRNDDGVWKQEAYIKASNPAEANLFGWSLALSEDGNRLVVGAVRESSSGQGVGADQDQLTSPAHNAGAVYVFDSTDKGWMQEEYIKASNAEAQDQFGWDVALSGDGKVLAVSAPFEDGGIGGIDPEGGQADNSINDAGAVYLFDLAEGVWEQRAYVKTATPETSSWFGGAVTLSADGLTLAIGATHSNGTGAVYMFESDPSGWQSAGSVTGLHSDDSDRFGYSVSLSADGAVLSVGAVAEDGGGLDPGDNSTPSAGAAYVFESSESGWQQTAYVKPERVEATALFGSDVHISPDGSLLLITAQMEDNGVTGVNAVPASDLLVQDSGAAFIFEKEGAAWKQVSYIKPPFVTNNLLAGFASDVSDDFGIVGIGARYEGGAGTGLGADPASDCESEEPENCSALSGAVYVY